MKKYLVLAVLVFTVFAVCQFLYSLDFPVDDYNEFLKRYGYLEGYYERWKDFLPERDYPDDKEVDLYLKLEKEGKLPKNVTIYHNDNEAIPAYREFLMSQPESLRKIFDDIHLTHPTVLNGQYAKIYGPWIEPFSKTISIPKIDYFLFKMKELKNIYPTYSEPYELCVLGDWMVIGKELFKKEIEYYKEHVLPIFRGMVLSGSFNPYILKVLYLYGEKDILPVAFEAAKTSGIAFTMWGREYLSFNRRIRVIEFPLEFKPNIVQLLGNEQRINEGSQFDAILWLYGSGELPNHLDLLFRILDREWFGINGLPDKYLYFLWEIKDERIKQYFRKNIDRPKFKEHRDKMHKYIKEFK